MDYFENQKRICISHADKYEPHYEYEHAVKNVFQKIDSEEFNQTIGMVMNPINLIMAQSEIERWNTSFTGIDHRDGDFIFWFYDKLGENDYIMRTVSEGQIPLLEADYKFVGWYPYSREHKEGSSIFFMVVASAQVDVDRMFPVFEKYNRS